MERQKKEENVTNLVTWLHQEASRGKTESESDRRRDPPFHRKSDQHSSDIRLTDDETCPLGCNSKHLLASCPVYHKSSLNQRWDIVRRYRRCRKCLRGSHHTNDCKKADGTSCDKCKKNHHRSLHNEKKSEPLESNLRRAAPIFTSQITPPVVENRSIQGSDNEKTSETFLEFAQCRKSRLGLAMETSTNYLPCWTPAQTRVYFPKKLQNNWGCPVHRHT